jgi:hypothetical protein
MPGYFYSKPNSGADKFVFVPEVAGRLSIVWPFIEVNSFGTMNSILDSMGGM